MPHYVLLMTWTESKLAGSVPLEGDDSGDVFVGLYGRLESRLGQFNAGLVSMHWTLGVYDMVAIVEADQDETIAGVALSLAQTEGVRCTTMRSFSMGEMRGRRPADGEPGRPAEVPGTVAEVNYRCHYG